MRWLARVRFRFLREQRGIALLETLVAVGIMAVAGIAFLQALNTISRSSGLYQQRVTAVNLAQSQVDEIKAMSYAASYSVAPSLQFPSTYNIDVSAVWINIDIENGNITTAQTDTGRQQVTVTVTQGGKPIFQQKVIKTNGG